MKSRKLLNSYFKKNSKGALPVISMNKKNSLFIFKYCILNNNCRGRLLLGTLLACLIHLIVTFGVKNRAVNHVVEASSSSWLQEHMTDMSERYLHPLSGSSSSVSVYH